MIVSKQLVLIMASATQLNSKYGSVLGSFRNLKSMAVTCSEKTILSMRAILDRSAVLQ